MIRTLFATLSPIAVLVLASVAGGVWPGVALIWVSLFVVAMDRVRRAPLAPRDDPGALALARGLTRALAVLHLGLIGVAIWALAGPGLDIANRIVLFLAYGIYFGQVANANAHELIHAPERERRRLGLLVYCGLLFGHHVSAHRLVHHVAVASDGDPNSAPKGTGFYRFWPRAWIGSFRTGLLAENRLRSHNAQGLHPYLIYIAGATATLVVAWGLGGGVGVAVWIALAGYAQMQLLLADYVQHYGLRRAELADGSLEPVGPRHSWNAPHWYSAAMMLNAPHHSDHHMHPGRAFPALRLEPDTVPTLPAPLPVMAALALVPPLWRAVMDPRLDQWRSPAGAYHDGKAALARARNGGIGAHDLPESGHGPVYPDSPAPDRPHRRRAGPDRHPGAGPDDERGSV